MVLRDGLVVVVEHDDEVRAHLADDVQPLQCLAAGHRAVADEGDDVFSAPRQIPRLCKPRGKADRGRCVPDVEEVMRTFLGIRIARHLIVFVLVDICLHAPCQHLVRVALVRHVVDDLVRGRVKDRVQGDDRLDDAEVRAEVSAVYARALKKCVAHLLGECLALCRAVPLDIGG